MAEKIKPKRISYPGPKSDVLVEWEDGSKNVVQAGDLRSATNDVLRKGSSVLMWWGPQKRWWKGRVVDLEENERDLSRDNDESDEDNLPLSRLLQRDKEIHMYDSPQCCETFDCSSEVWAACVSCLCLLCHKHFEESQPCHFHNRFAPPPNQTTNDKPDSPHDVSTESNNEQSDYVVVDLDNIPLCEVFDSTDESSIHEDLPFFSQVIHDLSQTYNSDGIAEEIISSKLPDDMPEACAFETVDEPWPVGEQNVPNPVPQPENFPVDGSQQEELASIGTPEKVSKKKEAKRRRNLGLSYSSVASSKDVQARRGLKPACPTTARHRNGLGCERFSTTRRQEIQDVYFDLGDLHEQRVWLASHVKHAQPKRSNSNRKKRTLKYYLPDEHGVPQNVCRLMFLNTVGVSERQVRTALSKTNTDGVLETEKRGGVQKSRQKRHEELKNDIKAHINEFPRTESHYCRKNNHRQYLAPDLTVGKMYRMYQEKNGSPASFSLYYKVFNSMNLKFHRPKKDMCSLCESYYKGNPEEKEKLQDKYDSHVREKMKVREIKSSLKEKSYNSTNLRVATFDLQQVIFLPRSNKSELFYKRRLSCYNFTVYVLDSKYCKCYLGHEGIASRGSNEIASHLHDFLSEADSDGIEEIALFADGCAGQNKNTIVASMLLSFVNQAQNVKQITLYYFETAHGQSEGDSAHSTIERALRKVGNLYVPSQLATVICLARKNPYKVVQVKKEDILDWKDYSEQLGVLRVRETEEGGPVSWTKLKQIRVKHSSPQTMYLKMSHLEEEFGKLQLGGRRSSGESRLSKGNPRKAYRSTAPRLSSAKYDDLMSLCEGITPVIRHPEHQQFYKELPH